MHEYNRNHLHSSSRCTTNGANEYIWCLKKKIFSNTQSAMSQHDSSRLPSPPSERGVAGPPSPARRGSPLVRRFCPRRAGSSATRLPQSWKTVRSRRVRVVGRGSAGAGRRHHGPLRRAGPAAVPAVREVPARLHTVTDTISAIQS